MGSTFDSPATPWSAGVFDRWSILLRCNSSVWIVARTATSYKVSHCRATNGRTILNGFKEYWYIFHKASLPTRSLFVDVIWRSLLSGTAFKSLTLLFLTGNMTLHFFFVATGSSAARSVSWLVHKNVLAVWRPLTVDNKLSPQEAKMCMKACARVCVCVCVCANRSVGVWQWEGL